MTENVNRQLETPEPLDTYVSDGLVAPAGVTAAGRSHDGPLENARILIVDDEELNIDLVRAYLHEAGYDNCLSTTRSNEAIGLVLYERPDLVLLDLMMPGVNGFDILEAMRADESLCHTPAIVLTAATDPANKLKALELGATDLLAKPVDPSELVLRLRNTLAAKAHQDGLANYSTRLEHEVRQRTGELEAARLEAIYCLARAAEFRDDDTGKHVMRVGGYAAIVARYLGFDEQQVEILELAAQLHDVGKIGVPDAVLLKPGKLDSHEFSLIQKHCAYGEIITQPGEKECPEILQRHTEMGAGIIGVPSSPIMRLAATIALTHHERWDGTGYPAGLAGDQIPIEGRITAVVDVYDALSSVRPYKAAFPDEKCFAIIKESRGSHFDPQLVDAFFACIDDILDFKHRYSDAT